MGNTHFHFGSNEDEDFFQNAFELPTVDVKFEDLNLSQDEVNNFNLLADIKSHDFILRQSPLSCQLRSSPGAAGAMG